MSAIKLSEKIKGNRNFYLKTIAVAMACCFALNAHANPTGAAVVNGQASFATIGNTLNITNSPNAIINWQGFSINTGETTRFIQQSASSSVLNRVLGADPSVLLGTLTSNGRVFLINPAGILVGQGARIDVPGFVASTLNLSNSNFLAGKFNFDATPNAGAIQNNGTITTPEGGTVYLIAPQIENNGIINTPKGETILAAGNTVQLVDTGTPGVTVQVTGTDNNAANLGQILVDSGRVGIVGAVVKNSSTISASSLVSQGGRVFLKASNRVEAGGTITANGTNGGKIEVLGNKVGVMDGATVNANGTQGGGTVLIGGDYQGKNPAVQNAQVTYVAPTATLSADATDIGNGGRVIVWADDTTRAYGKISTKGGANGGNGGFVEISGHRYLGFQGRVDTRAPHGSDGTLLLDPSDITIDNTADSLNGGGFNSGVFDNAASPSTLSWSTINAQAGNLEVRTTLGTGGNGDININASGTVTGPTTLTLLANNDIIIANGVSVSGNGDINLIAGWNNTGWAVNTGTGNITFNVGSSLFANGNIYLATGATLGITDAQVASGGNMHVEVGGNLTLTAASTLAGLQSGGTQTVNFTGGGAHLMEVLGGNTAGVGGAAAGVWSSGLQTINSTNELLDIHVYGGSAVDNTRDAPVYVNNVQQFDINHNPLTVCIACATWNWASIHSDGGQDIHASTITVNGGIGGNGNYASIENKSISVGQTITTTGLISLTGGTAPGVYNALYPNDSVSNEANIHSNGTQTITAGSIAMDGGGGANTLGGAFLTGKAGQDITTKCDVAAPGVCVTTGDLAMTGGSSTAAGQYGLGAPAIIGEQFSAGLALHIGGNLTMIGGPGSASPALIGSAQGIPGISITAADISMTSGAASSRIGVLTGGPAGTLSMIATTGNINQDTSSYINTNSLSALANAGFIDLAGPNLVNTIISLSASGNVGYVSAQTVHIGSATSTGGAGTVALSTTGAGNNLFLGTASGSTVNATSAGGIYDDNGLGITNITATTSSTLISTGATLGNLGVSADVNTPSITATVSGNYGGISIRSTGASAPTTIALTDSATVTPQGVSFYHDGINPLTLGAGMSFIAGSGDISIGGVDIVTYAGGATITSTGSTLLSAGNVLNINANAFVAGDLALVAPTVNITGGTASAGGNASVLADSLVIFNSFLDAGNNAYVNVSGDIQINATTSASITAVNNVFLTLAGATSNLYFNYGILAANPSYTGLAKVESSLPATIYLDFLGRSSGGVSIDDIETLTTQPGGSGFYNAGLPAVKGTGLVATYHVQSNIGAIIDKVLPPPITSDDIGPPPSDMPVIVGSSLSGSNDKVGSFDSTSGGIGGNEPGAFGASESASAESGNDKGEAKEGKKDDTASKDEKNGKGDKDKGKKDEKPGKC